MTATVHRYDEHTSAEWEAFINAMHCGEPFECDDSMFYYWLEVLPPCYMGRNVTLPNGRTVRAWFGFAEGEEHITAFWTEGTDDEKRYFGCRTNQINRG